MSWDDALMLKLDRIETRQKRIEQIIWVIIDPDIDIEEERTQITEIMKGMHDE